MDFCEWHKSRRGITPAPRPMFDFLERAIEQDKADPDSLEPYIRFFKSLPFHIQVKVPGKGRKTVIYDIVHAWTPPKGMSALSREACYLWDRENAFAGNEENDHIIIHGHTPTTYESRFVPEAVPGMILYRKNAINIDCGCVFSPRHETSPCMLAGICLETLEEIYPYTIEERMKMQLPDVPEDKRTAVIKELEKKHNMYLQNGFRTEMLERLGQDRIRTVPKAGMGL